MSDSPLLAEVQTLVDKSTQAETALVDFAQFVGKLREQAAAFDAAARKNAEEFAKTSSADASDVRQTLKQVAMQKARKESFEHHAKLVQGTEPERTNRLKTLHELGQFAESQEKLFTSAVQLLSRQGFGSQERSRFLEQLAPAGPREVGHLAELAEQTNNNILASALVSKLDTMPRRDRPLQAGPFAERRVGRDFNRAVEAIRMIRQAQQNAVTVDTEFVRNRRDTLSNIILGVAKRKAVAR
jgi:hypothetical protein